MFLDASDAFRHTLRMKRRQTQRQELAAFGKRAAALLDAGLDVRQVAKRLDTNTERVYRALLAADEYPPRLRARLAKFEVKRTLSAESECDPKLGPRRDPLLD
jgi:hypothetical protein